MKKTSYLLFLIFSACQVFGQNWIQHQKLVSKDRDVQDYFSQRVDIDGGFAIVGSPQDDHDSSGGNTVDRAGSAYIFKSDSLGYWKEVQKITAGGRRFNAVFGRAVSISGNLAVVGAPWDDKDKDGKNGLSRSGSVYIFQLDSTGFWKRIQKITASKRRPDTWFGHAVAIHGKYLVVGTHREHHDSVETDSLQQSGAAYVFEQDSTGDWKEVRKITARKRTAYDLFGYDVAISGHRILVGAYGDDHDPPGSGYNRDAGAAYVFERDSSGIWTQSAMLVPKIRGRQVYFGYSVSIDQNRIVVGSPRSDENEQGLDFVFDAGAAYIFELDSTGRWEIVNKLVAQTRRENDKFGASVDIDKKYVIVGAENHPLDESDQDSLFNAGATYLFRRSGGGNWSFRKKVVADDRAARDLFYVVGISDTFSIVGAYFEDHDVNGQNSKPDAGSAYIIRGSTCEATRDTLEVTACDSLVSYSGNYMWKQSGTYYDTIPNKEGCDSILMYQLTVVVNGNTRDTITMSVCDSLMSPSSKYTWKISGTYYDTIPNSNGCDSIIRFRITVGKSSISAINAFSCGDYQSPSGRYLWTTSGSYSDTLVGAGFCDSILNISLTVWRESRDTQNITACTFYESPSGRHSWTSSGQYTDTLTSTTGCDSIIHITLTIHGSTTSQVQVTACATFISPSGKYTWTQSGTYRDTIENAQGCDSLLLMTVSIHPLPVAKFTPNPNNSAPTSSPTFTFDNTSTVGSGTITKNRWDFGDPSTTDDTSTQPSPKYTFPAEPATYSVVLTIITDKGCRDSIVKPVIIYKTNSTYTTRVALITAHPNPSNGELTIKLDGYHDNVEVVIKSMSGEIIQNESYQSVSYFPLVINGSNGIYLMQIQTSEGDTHFIKLGVY